MVDQVHEAVSRISETPPPRLPWAVICWLVAGFFAVAAGYAEMRETLAQHGSDIVGLRRDIDYDRVDRMQFQAEMRSALGIRAAGK
jgi:hypothetical protein